MSGHTPGPWNQRRTAVYDIIEGLEQESVCFVSIREPETESANARLIAAAPDMLKTLESVRGNLARFKKMMENDTDRMVDEEFDRRLSVCLERSILALEEVVAKATGATATA